MEFPQTIWIPLGALLAALVAGFFSFLNLVSSKENKVSEFRLAWIDGLRNEISTYTSAVQTLIRIEAIKEALEPKEWITLSENAYKDAVENISKIHLRLNPKQAENNPRGHEAVLLKSIHKSRELFNRGELDKAIDSCDEIRKAAAPLLKTEWERVKHGEPGYQDIRRVAYRTVKVGVVSVLVLGALAVISTIVSKLSADTVAPIQSQLQPTAQPTAIAQPIAQPKHAPPQVN